MFGLFFSFVLVLRLYLSVFPFMFAILLLGCLYLDIVLVYAIKADQPANLGARTNKAEEIEGLFSGNSNGLGWNW